MVHKHGIEATVDRFLCVGSGPCFVLAPRAFQLDDDMKAVVLDTSAESEESLLSAAQECPTQAIYLALGGKGVYPCSETSAPLQREQERAASTDHQTRPRGFRHARGWLHGSFLSL